VFDSRRALHLFLVLAGEPSSDVARCRENPCIVHETLTPVVKGTATSHCPAKPVPACSRARNFAGGEWRRLLRSSLGRASD
jgi:hypothetical protein